MPPTNQILLGDALSTLKTLESESVDCIITSPPYWALRDYKTEGTIWDGKENCEHEWITKTINKSDAAVKVGPNSCAIRQQITEPKNWSHSTCSKCNAWKGELGQEPTIELYIKHLTQIFTEAKRVLKKTGTCWIVLGDTYGRNQGSNTTNSFSKSRVDGSTNLTTQPRIRDSGLQDKSLCLIPERFAISMIDNGWILRNKIIWYKKNCMPSSAKDRFTVDYEYIYFFVKSQKYYFKTQYEKSLAKWERWSGDIIKKPSIPKGDEYAIQYRERLSNPNGKETRIKRCVWQINTKPFPEAHFAVFPEQLVEQCLDAGCPSEICVKCGKVKEMIFKSDNPSKIFADNDGLVSANHIQKTSNPQSSKSLHRQKNGVYSTAKFMGYSSCNCNAGFESGICLDMFMGSGTTALVALKHNRKFIGIELNPEYIEIANKRIEPFLKQDKIVSFIKE